MRMTNKKAAALVRERKKGEHRLDQKAMEELAVLIEKGKYEKAYKHYRSMDTFVREGIPEDVVHHIQVKTAGGVRTITAHVRLKNCKKVFRDGFKPGVVSMIDMEFPKDTTDEKMAMAIVSQNDEVLDRVVEVVYMEGDEELCVMQTGKGR